MYKPKEDPCFDNDLFERVSEGIAILNRGTEQGEFLRAHFTAKEVTKAINRLHLRKACGYDNISCKEIKYAGDKMVSVLIIIHNFVIEREYIPINLRRGIQIPLFKGKNLDCLDSNNYCGTTLLTNLRWL